MKKLLQARYEAAITSGEIDELAPFGWWFKSQHFPLKWRMEWIHELFNRGCKVEPDFDLISEFEEAHAEFPQAVLDCLDRLVDQNRHMRLYMEKEKVKGILKTYLRGTKARKFGAKADGIVNRLGSRGYLDFRELAQEYELPKSEQKL